MSWFNLDSLNTTLTESLTQVSTSLNQVKTQVQSTLQIDDDLVEALTLRTASLTAERDAIDAEESRKETVKNYLAEMLPWETRDEEREILVEECKEVMLKLSCAEDTFEGPFASSSPNEVNEEEEEEGEEMEGKLTEVRSSSTPPHLDKLAKLEPLPPLLEEFDLDTHVGLIQRLLGVDENLSRVHSQLSNAGEKEKIFWKNYFFHCAYVRYENGLSVDEIWASKPSAPSSEELAKAAAAASQHESIEEEEEEDDNKDEESGEIVFESNSDDGDHPKVESSAGVVGTPATTTPSTGIITTTATTKNNSSPSSSTTQDNSYEMIANEAAAAAEDDDDDDVIATVGDVSYGGGDDNDDDVVDDGDLDLDDLDAEIARELED
mmetsp:Transcript_26082/g.34665  ORF Transcript_26082/g.34665 Transcript_26082/m.34665 type:complete len:379 (+) Transcript_26082:147-1283(+)